MIDAGLLTHRVTIQSPSAARDAHGQRAEGWTDIATVWAQVQPLRGREFFAAGAMQSEASIKVRMRYRDDVTGAMRVLWRGVAHAIVVEPIDVDGARHTLELLCSAGIRDTQ